MLQHVTGEGPLLLAQLGGLCKLCRVLMLLQLSAAGHALKSSTVNSALLWRVPYVGIKQHLRAGSSWHRNDAGHSGDQEVQLMASFSKGSGRPLTCSSCSNAQLQPPDLRDALCEAAVQHLVTQTVCNGRHVMWSPGLELSHCLSGRITPRAATQLPPMSG